MIDVATTLQMGGYGVFVWSAYGLAATGLVGMLAVTWRTLRQREQAFEVLKRERRGDTVAE